MKSHLIASRLSMRARVDAFFANGGLGGGGTLSTHSADVTAAAMNRAAGLSEEDIARYGAEREVRRQLGLGPVRVVTHSVSLIEDLVSGPCAECLDAVSGLGVPPHQLPALADLYEMLFEMKDAAGAADVFPRKPVWGPLGVENALAVAALEKVLGVLHGKGSELPDRFSTSGYSGGLSGFAHEELDQLLKGLFNSRYFAPDPVISLLGSPLEVQIGDLVRIALFVGFARYAGVQAGAAGQVRDLAVKALQG